MHDSEADEAAQHSMIGSSKPRRVRLAWICCQGSRLPSPSPTHTPSVCMVPAVSMPVMMPAPTPPWRKNCCNG